MDSRKVGPFWLNKNTVEPILAQQLDVMATTGAVTPAAIATARGEEDTQRETMKKKSLS